MIPLLTSITQADDTVAAVAPIGAPVEDTVLDKAGQQMADALKIHNNALDKAKQQMADALKIHNNALDYFSRPDFTKQHAVWKQKGDDKLKRAEVYYRNKREALVNAYGDAGLPAQVNSLYPPLL